MSEWDNKVVKNVVSPVTEHKNLCTERWKGSSRKKKYKSY